jgi:hypothetical protein
VPFLIVGFGMGLDLLWRRTRWGSWVGGIAVAVTVANGFFTFSAPLRQEFPSDFKARAAALLKSQPPILDGSAYFRMVNVDHFVPDPEVLPRSPTATLLASRHPLQYLPYLYEGESREKKALRMSIDHRMRLVRMAVPESERIKGEPYGAVGLSAEFPEGVPGTSEPLLSIGPRGDGDLFFIRYLSATTAELGYVNMGRTLLMSAPFNYYRGGIRHFELFSGALMPPDEAPIAGEDPGATAYFKQAIYATIDGQVLIDDARTRHLSQPGDVFVGVNIVEADAAVAQFSGHITGVARGGRPPLPKDIGSAKFGPLRLRVFAPAVSNGTAEPLVSVGVPGRAVLGYMRVFPDGTMAFGVEVWGSSVEEGSPLTLDSSKPLDAEFSFGSLYPEIGREGWNGLSPDEQRRLKREITIRVNGQTALVAERETPNLEGLPVYYGKNPIGGDVVNAGFSGEVSLGYRSRFGH